MISVWQKILRAWMLRLKDNVPGFKVFATQTFNGYAGNYILIEGESATGQDIKSIGWDNVIVRTKIVTKFETLIDDQLAHDAETVIKGLVMSIPGSSLVKQDDIQILEVNYQQSVPQSYNNGTQQVYELNTRWQNHIFYKL